MEKELLKVALRQNAVYLPSGQSNPILADATFSLVVQMRSVGYVFSEPLLHALNTLTAKQHTEILDVVNEALNVKLNWVPLVKGWDVPTGETYADHAATYWANLFGKEACIKGTRLPCGHLIPEGTFPLERYNGCPFCGTPFVVSDEVFRGQGSKLKELALWGGRELSAFFRSLLESPTALDATQADSLKILLRHLPYPRDVQISMKETLMLVVDAFVDSGREAEAQPLFATPTDILRYLWYKHTGLLQLVAPKTLVDNSRIAFSHHAEPLDRSLEGAEARRNSLKLHYSRRWCRNVAGWLNALPLSAEQACEMMHPKRGMWVRMIRALRLAEYAKRGGNGGLRRLLDVFYRQDYPVFQGRVDAFRLKKEADATLNLLKQRPGLFARSLFANMLWFGADKTLNAFREIVSLLPLRLLMTLGMYADYYFDKEGRRTVHPLGGYQKSVPTHKLLQEYPDGQLVQMVQAVKELYTNELTRHFAGQKTDAKTIFIAPELYDIPISVGDRSVTVQDVSCALQGTRFKVGGGQVRLFMQWGKGLPWQHLDMDLSCHIAYDDEVDICSYFNLDPEGAKHSGDIRSIPHQKGTAEYIELDLDALQRNQARYVVFTCNAYSNGNLSPNLVVGWMSSEFPMKVSEKNGVAYDPSCVQHQVRISEANLSKGLVFGVLDVGKREIVWLEMPFGGQTVLSINTKAIEGFLKKLFAKTTVGEVLTLKAQAQGLKMVGQESDADEKYTYQWALDAAGVSRMLLGNQGNCP